MPQMRQECIDNVSLVLGRKLTAKESAQIIERLVGTMSRLSRTDPDWGKLSGDERRSRAAVELAGEYQTQAKNAIYRLQLQTVKQARAVAQKKHLADGLGYHAYKGLGKMMDNVYRLSQGIRNESISQMMDTINGIGSKYFGFVESPEDVAAFVTESFGFDSGNARARKAWSAWQKVTSDLRDRANKSGADIGELDYGYIPQSHDSYRVAKARKTLNVAKDVDDKSAWISFIMPLLDRNRYVDIDGNNLSDSAMVDLLSSAYDDIVTSGSPEANIYSIYADMPKTLAQTKKYHSRVLHFKDPESFVNYSKTFGNGSMTGSLIGHISKMSRDIALMEEFGPKPKATYDALKFIADQEAKNAYGVGQGGRDYKDRHGIFAVDTDALWRVLTGEANHVAIGQERVARFMQGWRNLEMAGKLGKAFITSFSDIPTYLATSGFNNLPFFDSLKFMVEAYGKDWKEFANLQGIIAESIASDFCRWGSDNLGQGWTSKMTNATLSASFLNAFTDATRRAFSLNMMHYLGKLIDTDWADLDSFTRKRLEYARITERDWVIWQTAGTVEHNGLKFLSPNSIRSLVGSTDPQAIMFGFSESDIRSSASRMLGYIISESEMASLAPDLTMRAESTRGAQRGTFGGELSRSFYLFKSFPFTFMRKQFERTMFTWKNGSRADALQYASWVALGTTVFGAIALQTQNLLNGKDLQDAKSKEFWMNALVKGGGLGILGDFIVNGVNQDSNMYGRWSYVNFAGPVAGTTVEMLDTVSAIVGNSLYDKDVNVGTKLSKTIRSHMPFINLWYTSTAVDRYVMNDIQEALSPGYLRRMEQRQKRSTGQEFWWRPQDAAPSRAPKMAEQPNK